MMVLNGFVASGQLDVDASKVSERALLQAGLDLGVTVTERRPDDQVGMGGLRVTVVEGATIEATADGCVYVLYLRGSGGTDVPKEIPAIPGGRRWLSIDVLVGQPVVGLSPGAGVTICGVDYTP